MIKNIEINLNPSDVNKTNPVNAGIAQMGLSTHLGFLNTKISALCSQRISDNLILFSYISSD